jgi:hypothetical protein
MDPPRGIVRYEFLELISRIAARKYLSPAGPAEDKAKAVKMLIEECLKPNI